MRKNNIKTNRRLLNGETQLDLAIRLDVEQPRIGRLERDFDNRSIRTLTELKILLEVCPLDELDQFKEAALQILNGSY